MILENLGLAIGAPPKAFQTTTLLAAGMERKRKGGSSDLPASFFLRLAKKTCEWQGTPEKFLVFRFFFYKKDEYEGTD